MKTFKTLLAAVLMLTAAASANAQSVSYPRFHLGLRGGVSVNFPTDMGSLTFPHAGVSIDFRLAPIPLYFETGVYWMDKGGRYKYDSNVEGLKYAYNAFSNWYDNDFKWGKDGSHYDCHVIYLPLLLSWHQYLTDKMALQPFVGAIIGGGVGEDSHDDEFESALRFGLGFNLGRLYLNVGYDLGLTEYHGIKNNTFFATLGVNIIGASR